MLNERLEGIYNVFPVEGQKIIVDAYKIVETALLGMRRGNDASFIEHPLGVAEIITSEIGLGADSVVACFLHEASRFKPELMTMIQRDFNEDIYNMVVGLNNISKIRPNDTKLEAETYRKLIISYSKDPRVTLIKLADRLEVMRSLDLLPKSSRQKKIAETILLYTPLAHQLGLYRLKSELENLYFKNFDAENYRLITNKLKVTETDRQRLVTAFINPLKGKLDSAGIKYELKARTKTAYSIWGKMQAKNMGFEGVFDVFAMRFIIEAPLEKEHDLCWQVYSLVTEEYVPDVKRLRDWITKPKPNGYESLHTTVTDKNGVMMEVQIRTKRMDDMAENGLAAHWAYKGIKREKAMDSWLSNVKKMLENSDTEAYNGVPLKSLDEIFVYTPIGDLRMLPKGATVLDFAFDIHTNLGIRCTGAKIDGKLLSIKDKIHTGDVIDIISSKNQKPSLDWLNFAITSKARAKIKQKVKEEEFKKVMIGKELLERRLKNWKVELTDEIMGDMLKTYKFKSVSDFYSALGVEEFNITDVKEYIAKWEGQRNSADNIVVDDKGAKFVQKEIGGSSGNFLMIGKLNDIGYKLAKCCTPIYGDDVFAFISSKDGVKIHRMSCPNAATLLEAYPYRVQMVKWKENQDSSSFHVNLKVIVDDEFSIGQTIMQEVNKHGVSIRSFSIDDKMAGRSKVGYDVNIQIYVGGNHHLDKLIFALKKIKGVRTILRQTVNS